MASIIHFIPHSVQLLMAITTPLILTVVDSLLTEVEVVTVAIMLTALQQTAITLRVIIEQLLLIAIQLDLEELAQTTVVQV